MELNIDKTGWKSYRFDEFAQNISQRVEPKQTDLEIYVGLEHLDPDSLHIKRNGTPADVEGTKLKFYKGDVIFGKRRAYQRKAALAETDGICSAHAMVLRANTKLIDERLFPFFFHSKVFQDIAVKISVGGLSPTINWKDLAKQEFLLPPKDQQARLAELLWAADEVVEREREVKERLERTINAYLTNFFNFPKELSNQQKIKDMGNVFTGSTPSTRITDYWDGEFPFISPSEIGISKYPNKTGRTVTKKGLLASRKIVKGDLLVTCVGEIGRIAIANELCCSNQQMNIISPYEKEDSEYIYYLITFHKKLLENYSTTSVVPILIKSTFEDIELPMFTSEKRAQLKNQMLDFEKVNTSCNELIDNSIKLKQGLINEIF